MHEFYASGKTYEELHERTRQRSDLWSRYVPDTSFKFRVDGYNHSIPQKRQTAIVESFAFMDFLGKIEMKTPEITLCVFEECTYSCSALGSWAYMATDPFRRGVTRHKHEGDGQFLEVYFGRLVRLSTRYVLRVNSFYSLDCGGHGSSADTAIRREETIILWQYQYGGRDITINGESDTGTLNYHL